MASRFAMSPGFSGALHSAYNPGSMIDGAQKGRSLQNQAMATGEAEVANAIRLGDARIAGAEYVGAGTEAQGAAKGHASMMGGLSSGIGSIAGGIGKMNFGGGNPGGHPGSLDTPGFGMDVHTQHKFGAGGGSMSGFGTLGPNWGFPSP